MSRLLFAAFRVFRDFQTCGFPGMLCKINCLADFSAATSMKVVSGGLAFALLLNRTASFATLFEQAIRFEWTYWADLFVRSLLWAVK
jgi:hypothetical protein